MKLEDLFSQNKIKILPRCKMLIKDIESAVGPTKDLPADDDPQRGPGMTVAELICILADFPSNAEIYLNGEVGELDKIEFIDNTLYFKPR